VGNRPEGLIRNGEEDEEEKDGEEVILNFLIWKK
jgi:hypothetical protein